MVILLLHFFIPQAVTFIFISLGTKCVPYIPQVIPSLLNVIRTAESIFKDFLLQQLATLINVVKQHIRNYLDDIFKLIKVHYCICLLNYYVICRYNDLNDNFNLLELLYYVNPNKFFRNFGWTKALYN